MRALILGVSGLVLGAAILWGTRSDPKRADAPEATQAPEGAAQPTPKAAPPPPPVVTNAPLAPTTAEDDLAAPAAPEAGDAAGSSFAEAMASSDPFERRDAIEKAIARKDVSALPAIMAVDLTQNGYVAASAIDAVGKLGALAEPAARSEAVKTLDRWLRQESKRNAQEALGNASIAVDALAETKSAEAVAPLVSALDAATLPLHIETRIVESLDALGAKSAAPSVARFAARVSALKPADDFEAALATEALAAANAALAKWTTP